MPRLEFSASRDAFLAQPKRAHTTLGFLAQWTKRPEDMLRRLESLEFLVRMLCHLLISERKTTDAQQIAEAHARIAIIHDFLAFHYQQTPYDVFQNELQTAIDALEHDDEKKLIRHSLQALDEQMQEQDSLFNKQLDSLRAELSEPKQQHDIDNYAQAHADFYTNSMLFYFAMQNHHARNPAARRDRVLMHKIPDYDTASKTFAGCAAKLQALDAAPYHLSLLFNKMDSDRKQGILRHDLMHKAQEVRQHHIGHPHQSKLFPHRKDEDHIQVIAKQYLENPYNSTYALDPDILRQSSSNTDEGLAPLLFNLLANPALSELSFPLRLSHMHDMEYVTEILKLNTSLRKLEIYFKKSESISKQAMDKLAEVFEHNITLQELPENNHPRILAYLDRNRTLAKIQKLLTENTSSVESDMIPQLESSLRDLDELYWRHDQIFMHNDRHVARMQVSLIQALLTGKLSDEEFSDVDLIKRAIQTMSKLARYCPPDLFATRLIRFCDSAILRFPDYIKYVLENIPPRHLAYGRAQSRLAHHYMRFCGKSEATFDERRPRLIRIIAHLEAAGDVVLANAMLGELFQEPFGQAHNLKASNTQSLVRRTRDLIDVYAETLEIKAPTRAIFTRLIEYLDVLKQETTLNQNNLLLRIFPEDEALCAHLERLYADYQSAENKNVFLENLSKTNEPESQALGNSLPEPPRQTWSRKSLMVRMSLFLTPPKTPEADLSSSPPSSFLM